MKICIIGVTGHYSYVLDALAKGEDFQIAGLAPGSSGERADVLMDTLKNLDQPVRYYADYQEMLSDEKPDIAVVCPFFKDNARVAMEAMKRGIHVFGEKPSAITFEELDSLKSVRCSSGVDYAAMLGIRYDPWFYAAYEKVREGAIGKIRLMNAQKSYKLGTRGDNFKARGIYGGTIPWVGSHAIDWLHWISGARFKSVYASHSSIYNRGHGELEVSALCHFDMDNGIAASVSIDYLRPDGADGHSDDRIRIVGTEGIIEVRDSKVFLMDGKTRGELDISSYADMNIFSDFVKQVRGKSKCMVSADDSFYTTEACLRARLSADENRVEYF